MMINKYGKKITLGILSTFLAALLMQGGAFAAYMPVDLSVNEKYVKTDTAPIIENGTVLIPARAAADALGCDSVKWDQNSKTATLINNGTTIKITIGKSTALVNGKSKKLSSPAKLVNDRTLVPVRFIAENFSAKVSWDEKTYTCLLYTSRCV